MASLRSRNKAAGRTAGFFGQLNVNTARRKTQAENIERMTKQAELHKSNTAFAKNLDEQNARRKSLAPLKGHVNKDRMTTEGVAIYAAQNNPEIFKMNPVAQAKALKQLDKSINGNGVNAFFEIEAQEPIVRKASREVSAQVVAAISPLPDVPVATAGPGGGSIDPVSPATTEPAVQAIEGTSEFEGIFAPTPDKFSQASGKFLDQDNNPVSPAIDPATGRPFIITNGEKDFNVTPIGIQRKVIRQVNLRAANGDILTGEEFTETLNPVTGNPEIFKGGKYIPSPSNTVTTKKTEAQGDPAKRIEVDFSDKENQRLALIDTAVTIVDDFLATATLEDRGPKFHALRAANAINELVISTGLKSGGDVSLAEIVALHKKSADVYGDEFQLTIEEEAATYQILRRDPTAMEAASFKKGELDAMGKLLPMLIVRAIGGTGRVSTQIVQTVKDVVSGKPSTHAAASLGKVKDMMNESRLSIFEQLYTDNDTPQAFRDIGWTYGGDVEFDRETGTFKYSIVHPTDQIQLMLEVRTNPTVALLNRKRESILRKRRSQ